MTAAAILLTGDAVAGAACLGEQAQFEHIHVAGLTLDTAAAVLEALDRIDGSRIVLWVGNEAEPRAGIGGREDTEAATDLAACCRIRELSLALIVSGTGDAPPGRGIINRLRAEYLVPCFFHDPDVGDAHALLQRAAAASKPPQQAIDARRRLTILMPTGGSATRAERVTSQAVASKTDLALPFSAPTHVLAILFRGVRDFVLEIAQDEDIQFQSIAIPGGDGLSIYPLRLDCYTGLRIRLSGQSHGRVEIAGLITRPFSYARPTLRNAVPDPFPPDLRGDPIDDLVKMGPRDLTYRPARPWDASLADAIVDRARLLPMRELYRLVAPAGPRSIWFEAAMAETFVDRVRKGEPVEWICPLTGEAAELRGGVPMRAGTMMFARLREGLVTLIVDGAQLAACHYHAANLCLFYKSGPTEWKRGIIAACVSAAAPTRSRRTYLAAAFANELATALVAGDRRPAHYLSQNVNALGRFAQEDIDRLKAAGGQLVLIRDWCFLDPRDLLPALRALPLIEVKSSELTTLARRNSLRCIRPVRLGSRTNFSTLLSAVSRGSPAEQAADDALGLWICLDAERMRVVNQVDLLVATLEAIRASSAAQGRRIVIYWDGWTLAGGQMTDRDARVIASIRTIAADIVGRCSFAFEQVELFTHTMLDKVKIGGGARLAFATYGTAGLTPNVVGGIHLVSYHVSQVVDDGGFADESNVSVLPPSAIQPVGKLDEGVHLHEFIVDPAALIAASLAWLGSGAAPH